MLNRLKISRTSKTHVSSLQSFKADRPKSADAGEPEVSKEDVILEESSVGDAFQDIFGEAGQELQPHEVSNASKPHVRKDDEPEHMFEEEEPPKRQYTGQKVDEGDVNASKATEVESVDLDDLISLVMDEPADDGPTPSSPKRSTSTPSKDEGNDADFGDALSLIRGDDYEPPAADDKPAGTDETGDKRSGADDERSRRPLSGGTSTQKPMGGSSVTTTTTRTSYSSKFVPNIPESFYKDLESRLEDLIFKFECLDNEYAALQKISHNTSVETLEIKKIFTREY